jgi:NAD(P)-dependent dehydrogenase (short-subunit alcohol dehydrogenase family)
MQGEVVLITGAARGIGRYIAGTFAEAGARLAIADVLPLDTTAEQLRAAEVEPLLVPADVSDESSVRAMIDRTLQHFGQIDVLVNNAGIATHGAWEPHWPRIRDMDKAFWDRVMDTNLGGTMLCTKHALPAMEARRAGHILNLYGGGRPETFGSCVYVTSKEAIKIFTRFVAEEEREHNICIMAVTPGAAIATELAPENVRQQMPGVELVGNRFVLAAQAGMDMSGRTVTMTDGKLEILP